MKRIVVLLIVVLSISCTSEPESNVLVTGEVRGLKKGTLYLQRLQDTTLVVVDSMLVNGEPEFVLQTYLEEPEVLHLQLNSNSAETPMISFFATPGTTRIHTSLKRFFHDAKIEGSEQQRLMTEFSDNMSKFNDMNLDLIKSEFETVSDSIKLDSIRTASDKLLRRKYLYAINFAINNKHSQVAPYIALSEVYDANVKYLDTIYNVLPDSIASSKYGKQLAKFISERKTSLQ